MIQKLTIILISLSLIALTCCFLDGAYLKPAQAITTTTLYLSPIKQTVVIGEEVLISVNVISVNNLYSCQISLDYDSNLLKYEDASEGTFLNANGQFNTLRINPLLETGKIKGYAIARVGRVPGASGNGQIAVFRFRAIAAGTANIKVSSESLQGTKLLNANLESIIYTADNTAVTIAAVQQTSLDQSPPFIKSASPLKNSLDIPRNTSISIDLVDTGKGVDLSSIVITVNKTKVSLSVAPISNGYNLTYQPPNQFDYNQLVEITVNAKDLANPANVMPQERYSFITEAAPDVAAPEISQIQTTDINDHSARIIWQNSEVATAKIFYKPFGATEYQETKLPYLARSHSMTLDNLLPETVYVFQIQTQDMAGNTSSLSQEQTFTTTAQKIIISKNNYEGRMVKASGPNVYLIENNKKRIINSAQIFESHGWQWTSIITITDHQLNSYSSGDSIAPGRHGQIIKSPGPQVYLIERNLKRPILSVLAFESHGFKWTDVINVDETELASFALGPNLSIILKQGKALVKLQDDPQVWLIEKNQIRVIRSAEIFNAYKFKWLDIQIIDSIEKNNYSQVRFIKGPNNPNVFHLTNELTKNLIPSIQDFETWVHFYNASWQDIIELNQPEIDSYTTVQALG